METETKTVEQMSEPFAESSPQQDFEKWAGRVISHGKQEKKEKEKNSCPREISLEDRSDEEKKFLEAVGEKDESEKQPSAKGSAEKDAANRTDAKENTKPDTKAADKPATSEPLSGDRHWQALEGKVHFNEREMQDHWKNVNSRAGVVVQFVGQHPDKAQIEQGFRALMAGRPQGQGLNEPFFRDLSLALAEVPNPGEVFHHITMQPQDREVIRSAKNWKELRAAIHTVSKHYPAGSQASSKPRAPKPPGQVGFSGAADDGTRGEMGDFTNFSSRMSQRYARQ